MKIHAASLEALRKKERGGENRRKLNLPKKHGAFLCLLLSQLFRISCIKSCDTHDSITKITLQIVRFEVEIRGGGLKRGPKRSATFQIFLMKQKYPKQLP